MPHGADRSFQIALVLGLFSVVACSTRRGLLWASPRRLPGRSAPHRDLVAAGWPAAGCTSPPIGDDGRLHVVARRPLLGGAPLPDTSAVSSRTLASGGVHGSLYFRIPPFSLPIRFAALHICRFVFLFFLSRRAFSRLFTSLYCSRAAQPNKVSFIASSASRLHPTREIIAGGDAAQPRRVSGGAPRGLATRCVCERAYG